MAVASRSPEDQPGITIPISKSRVEWNSVSEILAPGINFTGNLRQQLPLSCRYKPGGFSEYTAHRYCR